MYKSLLSPDELNELLSPEQVTELTMADRPAGESASLIHTDDDKQRIRHLEAEVQKLHERLAQLEEQMTSMLAAQQAQSEVQTPDLHVLAELAVGEAAEPQVLSRVERHKQQQQQGKPKRSFFG
ncbi:hypothetical protein [Paenibacillus koleovorans]|uniref:hypothetical protein n=1 Tax=Paenibacillus koleovorans TaxID=121608 RepID=UPI000FDB0267|nr:hypothetical protein [Paenibacillus koleovorans]